MDPKVIGRRLKFFRQRAKLSQMELELKTNNAFGTISRIESGRVNPTKETINLITKSLHLNKKEIEYISGSLTSPANEYEIINAINSIKDHFNKPGVIAYLLDDRWRFIYGSKYFASILGVGNKIVDSLYLKSLMEIVLNKELGISNFLRNNSFKNILSNQLKRFYNEVGFMVDDPSYISALNWISRDQLAYAIWTSIIKNPFQFTQSNESREITFTVKSIPLNMHYSREPLFSNPRFEVIEYTASNLILKSIQKLTQKI